MGAARCSLEQPARANRFEEAPRPRASAHPGRHDICRQPFDDLIDRARAVAEPHDRGAGFIQQQRGFGEQEHLLVRDRVELEPRARGEPRPP